MAYSSCSINQIENEAVVAQLLREAKGSLELVDMTGKFPGLNWLPGLDHWKVFDRDGRNYQSMTEVPDNLLTQIRPEMFPPTASEVDRFHLGKCMRFLPHLNDDGGFFVATLRKTGPIECKPVHKERAEKKEKERKKSVFNKPKLDTFLGSMDQFEYVTENDKYLEAVMKSTEFLGAHLPTDNLYKWKYCDSKLIRLVSDNLRRIMHSSNSHLRVGGTPGVPVLRRNNLSCSDHCPFAPLNRSFQSLDFSKPKKNDRKLEGNRNDIEKLLNATQLEVTELSDDLYSQLYYRPPGWMFFTYKSDKVNLRCPGYFSHKKIHLNLGPMEKLHYKFLLDLN